MKIDSSQTDASTPNQPTAMHLRPRVGTDIMGHASRGLQELSTPDRQDYVIVVLVILFLTLIILILNPVRRCRWCVDPQDTPEARDRRFRDSMRPATNASAPRMSDRDRREFISNLLVTKRVVLTTGGGSKPDVHKFQNMILPRRLSSMHSSADRADGSADICSICLNEYEDGEEICWSHNKSCDHVFHRQCIMEWLVRHDECPICRQNFLSVDDMDEERVDEETEHSEQALERSAVFDESSTTTASRPFRSLFNGIHLTRARVEVVEPRRQEDVELAEIDSAHSRQQPATEHQQNDEMDDANSSRSTEETINVEPGVDDSHVISRPEVELSA